MERDKSDKDKIRMEHTIPSVFDELEEERKPLNKASGLQRLVNYIIDISVFWVSLLFITLLLSVKVPDESSLGFYLNAENFTFPYFVVYVSVIMVLYYGILEGATKGRTIGKLLTHTKAVKKDGTDIGWGTAFKRSLCRLVPLGPFSIILLYPWHYTFSKTTVIKMK